MRIRNGLVWGVLTVLFIWAAPFPAAAENQLYRYQDAQGNWSYTDNLADVPPDQREACKRYESVETTASQSARAERAATTQDGPTQEVADQRREELLARKADLDQEYDALVDESAELEKQSLNLTSDEGKKAFEDRKNTFTQRLKVFEERRQIFDKDLQAYKDVVGNQKN